VAVVGCAFMGAADSSGLTHGASLDDVDAIDICTPGDGHERIAGVALEEGEHVLCEKPLTDTIEQAEPMAAAAHTAAGVPAGRGAPWSPLHAHLSRPFVL
jgi:predicted dehydrogenase